MTTKELRAKSEKQFQNLLAESRDKLREMRFRVAQRQLKKVRDIRVVKKEIAQIMTILKEKRSHSERSEESRESN